MYHFDSCNKIRSSNLVLWTNFWSCFPVHSYKMDNSIDPLSMFPRTSLIYHILLLKYMPHWCIEQKWIQSSNSCHLAIYSMSQLRNCKGPIDSAQIVVAQLVSFQAETKCSWVQPLNSTVASSKVVHIMKIEPRCMVSKNLIYHKGTSLLWKKHIKLKRSSIQNQGCQQFAVASREV